ncbi:hypothetical protein HK100_007094, partial [Physocladia obscura]
LITLGGSFSLRQRRKPPSPLVSKLAWVNHTTAVTVASAQSISAEFVAGMVSLAVVAVVAVGLFLDFRQAKQIRSQTDMEVVGRLVLPELNQDHGFEDGFYGNDSMLSGQAGERQTWRRSLHRPPPGRGPPPQLACAPLGTANDTTHATCDTPFCTADDVATVCGSDQECAYLLAPLPTIPGQPPCNSDSVWYPLLAEYAPNNTLPLSSTTSTTVAVASTLPTSSSSTTTPTALASTGSPPSLTTPQIIAIVAAILASAAIAVIITVCVIRKRNSKSKSITPASVSPTRNSKKPDQSDPALQHQLQDQQSPHQFVQYAINVDNNANMFRGIPPPIAAANFVNGVSRSRPAFLDDFFDEEDVLSDSTSTRTSEMRAAVSNNTFKAFYSYPHPGGHDALQPPPPQPLPAVTITSIPSNSLPAPVAGSAVNPQLRTLHAPNFLLNGSPSLVLRAVPRHLSTTAPHSSIYTNNSSISVAGLAVTGPPTIVTNSNPPFAAASTTVALDDIAITTTTAAAAAAADANADAAADLNIATYGPASAGSLVDDQTLSLKRFAGGVDDLRKAVSKHRQQGSQ